jgi:hypothetical protein
MKRRDFVVHLAGLAAAGIGARPLWPQPGRLARRPTPITVYKSSSCECCARWVDHIKASGFAPVVHDEEGMEALKDELGVPQGVRSCHTAIIEKYLIEGHVPASDIRRLLAERTRTAGLAVPGMPARTHGMAPAGVEVGGYDVLAFQLDGTTRLFERH